MASVNIYIITIYRRVPPLSERHVAITHNTIIQPIVACLRGRQCDGTHLWRLLFRLGHGGNRLHTQWCNLRNRQPRESPQHKRVYCTSLPAEPLLELPMMTQKLQISERIVLRSHWRTLWQTSRNHTWCWDMLHIAVCRDLHIPHGPSRLLLLSYCAHCCAH